MRKLKTTDLKRLSVEEFRLSEKVPVIIVLDNIRSHHNIGAIFRTADAFRAEGIHLCGITATPPHREIHKTALGSTDSVSWSYFPETLESIRSLRDNGYKIYGIEQTSESMRLDRFIMEKKVKLALVFGNEVKGIGDEVLNKLDGCIEIPQYGTKHSLNVSVAAGIVIWEITKSLL